MRTAKMLWYSRHPFGVERYSLHLKANKNTGCFIEDAEIRVLAVFLGRAKASSASVQKSKN